MSDKKANLFAKLAQQAANPGEDEPQTAEPVSEADTPSPALPPVARPKATSARKKDAPVSGKRANPDYCQANCYVKKSVRRSVDRALLDMEGLDYSTLVEDLLVKWLKSHRIAE